jgi:hypothetical protein
MRRRSAVSRRFVAMTEHALADLLAADLSWLDLVAIMIDGVHFADHLCVVGSALGSTGTKHPLALVEGSTENTTLVRSLLVGLRDRGLDVTRPILAVLLGLIAAAVEEAEQARIAVLLLPGVGTVEDLRKAHETGGRWWPGSRHTAPKADVSVQHFAARGNSASRPSGS